MRRPILFGLLILFVCAVVLTIIIGLVGFNPPEFKTFANMDELSFLDQYCVDQLDDPNLEDGLSVTDRKCIEVDYNRNHFHVYAYVFLNEADARSYFDGVEATMKKTMDGITGATNRTEPSLHSGRLRGAETFKLFSMSISAQLSRLPINTWSRCDRRSAASSYAILAPEQRQHHCPQRHDCLCARNEWQSDRACSHLFELKRRCVQFVCDTN